MGWEQIFQATDELAFIGYVILIVIAMNRGGMDTENNNGKLGTVKDQIFGFLCRLLKDEEKAKEYFDKIAKGEDVALYPSSYIGQRENNRKD